MFWGLSVDSLLTPGLKIKFLRNAFWEMWLRLYPIAASTSIFKPLDFKFKVSKEVKCLSIVLFIQQDYSVILPICR